MAAEGRSGRFRKGEAGAVSVLAAVGFAVCLGFLAVAVDAGRAFAEKQRLQNAVDAASLAGARLLPDQDGAETAAINAASANGLAGRGLAVEFPSGDSIRVTADGRVYYLFARILGFRDAPVRVTSRAVAGGVAAVEGLVPLAAEWEDFEFGQPVTLKVEPGAQEKGNFHAISLGNRGADAYENNMRYGYPGAVGLVSGGEVWLDTEPGAMAEKTCRGVDWRISQDPAATFDSVAAGSPRVVYVAVVDSFRNANGRDQVRLAGFAAFFLESCSGGGRITGRFMRWSIPGEIGGPDYGLTANRLVE